MDISESAHYIRRTFIPDLIRVYFEDNSQKSFSRLFVFIRSVAKVLSITMC